MGINIIKTGAGWILLEHISKYKQNSNYIVLLCIACRIVLHTSDKNA